MKKILLIIFAFLVAGAHAQTPDSCLLKSCWPFQNSDLYQTWMAIKKQNTVITVSGTTRSDSVEKGINNSRLPIIDDSINFALRDRVKKSVFSNTHNQSVFRDTLQGSVFNIQTIQGLRMSPWRDVDLSSVFANSNAVYLPDRSVFKDILGKTRFDTNLVSLWRKDSAIAINTSLISTTNTLLSFLRNDVQNSDNNNVFYLSSGHGNGALRDANYGFGVFKSNANNSFAFDTISNQHLSLSNEAELTRQLVDSLYALEKTQRDAYWPHYNSDSMLTNVIIDTTTTGTFTKVDYASGDTVNTIYVTDVIVSAVNTGTVATNFQKINFSIGNAGFQLLVPNRASTTVNPQQTQYTYHLERPIFCRRKATVSIQAVVSGSTTMALRCNLTGWTKRP